MSALLSQDTCVLGRLSSLLVGGTTTQPGPHGWHVTQHLPPVPRTPLHCAASCNSVHLCKQLVESGAAIFASTISDTETAADKCEEMEEGYIQCSQFLYGRWRPRPQQLLGHRSPG